MKVENTPSVPRTDSLSWTRSTPLSSQVLTPPMSEERNGRSYSIPDLSSANDILSEFYRQGFPVLSQHILSFLNPAEIATASLVCRSWRDIIHNLPAVRRKLQDYRARKKVLGQENVPIVLPQTVVTPTNAQRVVLSDLLNATLPTPITPIAVESPFPNGIHHSHRPCPSCISPARILSPSIAKCLKCEYEFCQQCLRRGHSPKPCSPKKQAPIKNDIIDLKKSKRSRRRL